VRHEVGRDSFGSQFERLARREKGCELAIDVPNLRGGAVLRWLT
jgi:hypothetical protein